MIPFTFEERLRQARFALRELRRAFGRRGQVRDALSRTVSPIMAASLPRPAPLFSMRAFITFGSLLIVLAVIALLVRNQLHAGRRVVPAGAASDAAASLSGSPQQITSQYQRQLNQAIQADAQHTADQAASAADEAR